MTFYSLILEKLWGVCNIEKEIAEYLRRDPEVITRYSKEGKRLESEIEKVYEGLRKSKKVNKQV
jgi:hypothetical protein